MATVNEKMTAIAENIRSKTGDTKELNLDDMANGINDVFDSGRKAEHGEFWDVMQSNGKRVNYYRAFCNTTSAALALGWNEITFRPKYDLKPSTMSQGFMYLQVDDLEDHLNKCGIVFDTQNCTSFQQAFQNATITVFPTLHLKIPTEMSNVFNGCTKLHTVRKIIYESGTEASFVNMFNNCTALANIDVVEGCIEHNISFSACPLTKDTIKRIITHLKDYTGSNEYEYTITLKTSALNSLESSGELSPNGNSWAEYIGDLKWNLTLA